MIIGRSAERARLRELLDAARAGMSGVLVLRGDPGIGKTALLEHATSCAQGMRVTRVAGVEAEQELAFAALHRVLLPVLSHSGCLPPPQRAALDTAFGRVSGPAPDRFLVGLAALTLLSAAAAERPLLVLCDDAHWVDRESLDVLAFVGRRLHADGVVMLFGVRDRTAAEPALSGLPDHRISGLPEQDALVLLAERSEAHVDRVIAQRIVADVGGNPLAIREIAGGVPRLGAGTASKPPSLGRRLEDGFLRRVRALSEPARAILLVAAADTTGDRGLVLRAAARMSPSTDEGDFHAAMEQVERDELLCADAAAEGTPLFRHPLIRSAVYGGAPRSAVRAAHACLAAVTDPDTDPDRTAWHLAAAADSPDEELADRLQACAE
ncbi:AAA family ATPase, partial [Streptomyces sp. NPDC056295]